MAFAVIEGPFGEVGGQFLVDLMLSTTLATLKPFPIFTHVLE